MKTWAFDSVGPKKYALQIKKASNGNPCLKIVEGVPQEDGTYRKFSLTVWSEDFARLFAIMDEVRNFIKDNNIRTPPGHKYVPGKARQWTGGGRGAGGGGGGQGGASASRPGTDSGRAYPARQPGSGRPKSAEM